MDKALDLFDNAYFSTLHYKECAKESFKEYKLMDKIKKKTKTSLEFIKTEGKIIKDKAVSEFEYVKNKTKIVKIFTAIFVYSYKYS